MTKRFHSQRLFRGSHVELAEYLQDRAKGYGYGRFASALRIAAKVILGYYVAETHRAEVARAVVCAEGAMWSAGGSNAA